MASLYESLGEKVETGEIKVEWRNEWVHLGMEKMGMKRLCCPSSFWSHYF